MKVNDWGKDHWSTFAYVECCCVDDRGKLDNRRLRINDEKRPIRSNGCGGWRPEYGTRIKGGNIPDPTHDDLDCLEDLEREGLLEQVGTILNPVVKLTEKGLKVSAELRAYKAHGGQFAAFQSALMEAPVG